MKKELPSYISNRLTFEGLASSRGLLQLADRLGIVTQRQAARELGLSAGTCNLHFQKLEHLGLLHRAAEVGGRGRSTIQWEVEKEKNLCIEIVFDVPFFLAALTTFDGTVLLSEREDLTGLTDVVKLEERVDRFASKAKQLAEERSGIIRQVFMGLPGMLDPTHSKVVQAVNFPVLNGVDFKELMKDRHGLACECGSLGKAFYYGEIEKLPPDSHAMVLHWDLGIGVVAGVGERIITIGHEKGLLADIGHIRIRKDGKPCHCGGSGCLEAYTGGWSMIDKLNRTGVESLGDFRKAVESGDVDALKVANEAAYTIGESLCWPIQVRGSERLIITGPLSPIFEHVRPAMIEGLATLFSEDEIASLNPQASKDPQRAMQNGAARLARLIYIYPEL
jgi:predicted NBD/HSP70 family sugar kinase